MDGYSGKRGTNRIVAPRKGYNIGFKDPNSGDGQNSQFCNRIGCSGRIKYTTHTNTKAGTSDKAKCSRTSCSSSNGDGTVKNSSRTGSSVKSPYADSKRKLEFNQSESSQSGDSEAADIGSSSISSNTRSQSTFLRRNIKRNTQPASRNPSLKNPNCNMIAYVGPTNSPLEQKSSGKNVMVKKRSSEGESSLSSRKGRQAGEDSTAAAAAIRTRRSMNCVNNNNSGTRLSYRQNGRNSGLSLREPSRSIGGQSSLRQFSANDSSSGSRSSFSLSSSNDENQSTMMMPFTEGEVSFARLMNREGLQRYTMDGIAEVLLALERIEQDAELTHEELLALETSLFLNGLNLYDQHRDMRLDIDNMSYEELLALEEKMGTVSTALSEEALLKYVTRSVYQTGASEARDAEDGDDVKCSICQEEFAVGDEIGKLVECQHGFHRTCVNQWLQMKNWCPICKASVAPQQPPSS